MPAIPHLDLPFRLVTGPDMVPRPATVEQDSVREITNCAEAVLRTPLGWRDDLPDFGVTEPEFRSTSPVDDLRAAVEQWEPRAAAQFTDEAPLEDALRRVTVSVGVAD